MAGDWIKMRSDLHLCPEVIAIASSLEMDPYAVVGRLHRLWSWADAHTSTGHIRSVTTFWVDHFLGAPGFCDALASERWLTVTGDGISIPAFNKHMSQSARARALATERKRRERGQVCHADTVTPVSRTERDKSVTREEKRRVEKSRDETSTDNDASVDANGIPRGFVEFWSAYPRKVGKQAALRAWRTHARKTTPTAILDAVKAQQNSRTWRDGFIPNPATWLNQGRWEDEPENQPLSFLDQKIAEEEAKRGR